MSGLESVRKTRRELLGLLGGLGAVVIVGGCGGGNDNAARGGGGGTATTGSTSTTAATTSTTSSPAATLASCVKIPQETAGPYPGDGTNGPNALTQSGIVRSDIRPSIGSGTTAQGVPLTIELTVADVSSGCRPRSGAAVYLWHCDAVGRYSMYSQGVTGDTFLRGVQAADANGSLTFTSVFPAAYSGRWPHIHFEVFSNAASATNGANKIAVSQLALPDDVCRAVYATSGYSASLSNLSATPITRDNVFSDGTSQQMATVTGSATSGYTAKLVVAV